MRQTTDRSRGVLRPKPCNGLWASLVRAGVARALSLPVSWLPLTASPLATDAARIMSKLDAFSREAS